MPLNLNEGNEEWLSLKSYNRLGLEFECDECVEPADWRRREDAKDFCNSCGVAEGSPDAYPILKNPIRNRVLKQRLRNREVK